jgi:hypothetical protein
MVLCSCSSKSDESEFITLVGSDIQHYLDITNLNGSSVRLNTVISLYIKNKTSDCIEFPYNFGVKIFAYQNHGWIEVPDNIIYASHKDVILDPRGLNVDAVVALQPDYATLGAISNKFRMRIVMIGHLCKNGIPSNFNTADYIELNVVP